MIYYKYSIENPYYIDFYCIEEEEAGWLSYYIEYAFGIHAYTNEKVEVHKDDSPLEKYIKSSILPNLQNNTDVCLSSDQIEDIIYFIEEGNKEDYERLRYDYYSQHIYKHKCEVYSIVEGEILDKLLMAVNGIDDEEEFKHFMIERMAIMDEINAEKYYSEQMEKEDDDDYYY